MTSTFVNDLRLNEMATGDQSGSWGTVTNTNLELIGEALGFGTEAPFNTDANKTTTVLDGASDPARAMYFKVTSTVSGGLTATRQLTIDPDTINRLMFIENATTGGESITIKQGSGSGAAVTIPNGDTKAVILSGSGSGSIVLDAFASLSVVDLKVQDDLTVTDDVAIGGILGVTGVLTTTAATVHTNGITMPDSAKAIFGGGDDLQIFYDGSNAFINNTVAGALSIKSDDINLMSSDSETMASFVENGAVKLYHDNAKKFETSASGVTVLGNIANASGNLTITGAGDMTLDAVGDIVLDAAGEDIKFFVGGSAKARFTHSSGDVIIQQDTQDKDFIFKVDDGGNSVNAMVIHGEVAGTIFLGAAGGNGTALIQGSSGAGGTNQPGTSLHLKGGVGGGTGGSSIEFFTAPGGSSGTSASNAVSAAEIDPKGRLYLGPSGTTIENQTDSTGAASFQFGNSFLCHFDTDAAGTMVLSNNKFFDGSNNRTAETGLTTDYLQNAGKHTFRTAGSASANAAVTMNIALVIETNKDITITDGNLVIGTAGHGIDFSAQTQSSSTTVSEILDHYEEGTTAPSIVGGFFDMGSGTIGSYTRVGNIVNFQAKLVFPSTSEGSEARITLPFVVSTRTNYFPTGKNSGNGNTAASLSIGITGESYVVFQNDSGGTSASCANLSGSNLNVQLTYQTTP